MVKVVATTKGYFGGVIRDYGDSFNVPDEVWNDKKRRPKWVKLDPAAAFGGKGDHDGDGSVGGSKPADKTDEGTDFDKMKVPELRAFAEENGIDLGEATKKADIIAILKGENVGNTTDAPTGEAFGDNGEPENVQGNGVQEALGGPAPDWVAPSAPVMTDE